MKRIYLYIFLITFTIYADAQILTLDSCLSVAQRNNLQMKNADLEIQKAQQVKYQALTKYFPNISAQAFAFHALNPLIEIGAKDIINGIENEDVRTNLTRVYNEYATSTDLDKMLGFFQYGVTAGATAIQPVFMGGQIVNGNRLAKLGVEAAKLQADITGRDIRRDVEQTYLMIVGLEEKKATLLSVNELLDTLTNNLQTAIQAGLTTKNDILKIELKRGETESQQLQLENGITLAKQALCSRLGIPYSDSLQVDTAGILTVSSSALPRPEKELLELNVKAEQLRKKMEIGKALPHITVGGSYAYNRLFKDKNQHNGLLFATVQVPITYWWETGHKIKEKNLQTEQAENNRQYLNEQMELQSLQAEQEVLLAEKKIEIAEKVVTNASENLRVARVNYEAGLEPLSELLEARTVLMKAENDLTDARLQLRLAQRKAEDYK
ncbi:MAG: TolC family protein [Paludibacteraceae bacterium]|nr:TolC family protein [Paludibacteraceae bacterium]